MHPREDRPSRRPHRARRFAGGQTAEVDQRDGDPLLLGKEPHRAAERFLLQHGLGRLLRIGHFGSPEVPALDRHLDRSTSLRSVAGTREIQADRRDPRLDPAWATMLTPCSVGREVRLLYEVLRVLRAVGEPTCEVVHEVHRAHRGVQELLVLLTTLRHLSSSRAPSRSSMLPRIGTGARSRLSGALGFAVFALDVTVELLLRLEGSAARPTHHPTPSALLVHDSSLPLGSRPPSAAQPAISARLGVGSDPFSNGQRPSTAPYIACSIANVPHPASFGMSESGAPPPKTDAITGRATNAITTMIASPYTIPPMRPPTPRSQPVETSRPKIAPQNAPVTRCSPSPRSAGPAE